MATTAIGYPTASHTIKALRELDIVRHITGRKEDQVLSYQEYLAILDEGAEPLGLFTNRIHGLS